MNPLYRFLWAFAALVLVGYLVLSPQKSRAEETEATEEVNEPEVPLIAHQGDTTVILTTEPCISKKVLKLLKPAFHKKYMRADVTYFSEHIGACYMRFKERGYVFILDETGDSGAVSLSLFKPMESI